MASSNLDLVRSIYGAWVRDDFSSVDWADPDIEFVLADGPDPGSWRGIAGMIEGWRALRSAWQDYRFDIEDFVELDDERVLVLMQLRGRGKTSGLELSRFGGEAANVLTVRDGRVVRLVLYFDRERALADAGIADLPAS